MEKQIVSGVAYSRDEAKITLFGVEDKPGVSARIFSLLAAAGVNVDMIVQANARTQDKANMVFTCTSSGSGTCRARADGGPRTKSALKILRSTKMLQRFQSSALA